MSSGAGVRIGDGFFCVHGFGDLGSRECSSVSLVIKAILLTSVHASQYNSIERLWT